MSKNIVYLQNSINFLLKNWYYILGGYIWKIVRKKIISNLLIVLIIISIVTSVYAHSGRTDSNEGHRDNKDKSELGNYHYHCGGYFGYKKFKNK